MIRLRNNLGSESGMSMVELLVGMVLMAIVMSIASASGIHAMRVQRRQVAEVDAVGRGRIAMERMTREIRAANPVLSAAADGSSITVQVTRPITGFNRKITTYTRVGTTIQVSGTLINTATGATTAMPTSTLLRGLSTTSPLPLFTYRVADGTVAPAGTDVSLYRSVDVNIYMALRESTNTVRVTDSVAIRNALVPS